LGFSVPLVAISGLTNAQNAGRIVTGAVYSCVINGVRHYMAHEPEDMTGCKTINYSFVEATQPDEGWSVIDPSVGMYYYRKGIKKTARRASVWVMYSYATDQAERSGVAAHRSLIERWSVDCSNQSVTTQQRTYYTGTYGKGYVVGQWQPLTYSPSQFVIPNTNGDALMKEVCRDSQK
jgi:hypothetical protein